MMFFAALDHNGRFEQVFAVSQDGRAVSWSFDKPHWRPLTPSCKLAKQVAGDVSLELLDHHELERLWTWTGPPRNFSLEWRTEERWSGWVEAGPWLFPAITLWFVWDDLDRFAEGYSELVAGVVIAAQFASLFLLREPLMRRIHWLSEWLEAQFKKRKPHSDFKGNQTGSSNRERQAEVGRGFPQVGRPSPSAREDGTLAKVRDTSDALEYATIALMSDAYFYQAKAEVAEKFGLSDKDAEEVARVAERNILRDLEARNPEAWKELGLSSKSFPKKKANPQLDDLVDRGRMAGMDPVKLRAAFEAVAPNKLREMTSHGEELAALDRKTKLQSILGNASVFGTKEGYYVEHRGRTFFYAAEEDSWTQLFPGTIPSDAVRLEAYDLLTTLFEESSTKVRNRIAQFVRLALEAVRANQTVQLSAKLPDGAESTARLHAAKWAGILLGFPAIVRDEAPGGVMEWHFNDYPGSATIYRVRADHADPLELVHEVGWMNLQQKVLENTGRAETQKEHDDLSEHELLHYPKGVWIVHVNDNFHYMDEDEQYVLGTFDSYYAAVTACQKIVDDFLEASSAKSADELFESYVSFGEDPWIEGPPPTPEQTRFSAWDYAKQRCGEIHHQS